MRIDPWLLQLSPEDTEKVVADYTVVQCCMRGLSPESFQKTYLPGIKAHFEQHRAKNYFGAAINSREIKLIVRGASRKYNLNNPKALRTKLPFDLNLAEKSREKMAKESRFSQHFPSEIAQLLREHWVFGS
jgi:hypothetical protein